MTGVRSEGLAGRGVPRAGELAPNVVSTPGPENSVGGGSTASSFLRVKALFFPKEENRWESQDAYAIAPFRCAVADGATRYWGSGMWARWLVSRYVFNPPRSDSRRLEERWKEWGEDLCRDWAATRYDLQAQKPGPWEQQKAEKGSAATFLGFEVCGGRWRAEGIGDAFLVHLRADGTLEMFPPDWEQTDKPNFIYSLPASNEKGKSWASVQEIGGTYRKDDVFLLSTDALVPILKSWKRSQFVLSDHSSFSNERSFAQFVRQRREQGRLVNDDTTLLIVSFRDDLEYVVGDLSELAKLQGDDGLKKSLQWYQYYLRLRREAQKTKGTAHVPGGVTSPPPPPPPPLGAP